MKLSFVIPAHNEAAHIGNCLKSILKETQGKSFAVEIIVVNNLSTDKTTDIAVSIPNVRVVDEERKGITYARQAGYLAATGDLIANVDADNILPPGWLEKVFSEFLKNDKLVGLSGPLIYHDLPWFVKVEVKIFYIAGYFIYLLNHFVLKRGGMMQGGNFVVRKLALDKIGGFNTNIVFYGEDTDIARRLQGAGYIKFTFKLPMFSSGRRLAKEGVLTTGLRYAVNYFWVLFFKKPLTKTVRDINK